MVREFSKTAKDVVSLLDQDGDGGVKQVSIGGASSRLNVPSKDLLHKADSNDTDGPSEVLGPSRSNGRYTVDGTHDNNDDGLEVGEKGYSIGGNVGGRKRRAKSGNDGGGDKTNTGDDGSDPLDADMLNGLFIGKIGLDTSQEGGVGVDYSDNSGNVDIRDGVGDAGNVVDDACRDLGRGLDVNSTRYERAKRANVDVTRVDCFSNDFDAVGVDFDNGGDVAPDL